MNSTDATWMSLKSQVRGGHQALYGSGLTDVTGLRSDVRTFTITSIVLVCTFTITSIVLIVQDVVKLGDKLTEVAVRNCRVARVQPGPVPIDDVGAVNRTADTVCTHIFTTHAASISSLLRP